MSGLHFTVVMPCYNEQDGLQETIRQLYVGLAGHGPFEVVVVDDGSTDGSREILNKLTAQYSNLRPEYHQRNRGYGAALKTGIRSARSDFVVITDADGTYPNDRIPDLVSRLEDADMVVGARVGENVTYSKLRAIPKQFLSRYTSWVCGVHVPDMNSGLRAFRKGVIENYLALLPDSFSFTTTCTIAFHTNYHRVAYVPINYATRKGTSKIKPIRDTLRFLQLIARTGMYFAPLRVLFPIFCISLMLFVGSLAYDIFYLKDITESTILLLVFCGHIIMFALLADMIDKRVKK